MNDKFDALKMKDTDKVLADLMKNKEPLSNIAMVHRECAQKRLDAWQANNKDTVIKEGDAVKVMFVDENEKVLEHMWVRVKDISEDFKLLTGVLDNDPFLVKNVKFGQVVTVRRDHVSQHLTT